MFFGDVSHLHRHLQRYSPALHEFHRRTNCDPSGARLGDDDDGIREVHINTTEGLWTGARNFLRPFRGVHKDHLAGYVAMCKHSVNLKRITPGFIAALVRCT